LVYVDPDVKADYPEILNNPDEYPARLITESDSQGSDDGKILLRCGQIRALYTGNLDDMILQEDTIPLVAGTEEGLSMDLSYDNPTHPDPTDPDMTDPAETAANAYLANGCPAISLADAINRETRKSEPDSGQEISLEDTLNRELGEAELEIDIELCGEAGTEDGIDVEPMQEEATIVSLVRQPETWEEERTAILIEEFVADDVTKVSLDNIEGYTSSTGVTYSRIKLENAMMAVLAMCYEHLRGVLYEQFMVVEPSKKRAFYLGSRPLLVQHGKSPQTRSAFEKDELKERLRHSLEGKQLTPEQGVIIERVINGKSVPVYLSMARYCETNKGSLYLHDIEGDVTPEKVIEAIMLEEVTVALYSPDEGFLRGIMDHFIQRRGIKPVAQVTNMHEYGLTCEGRTVNFVGPTARRVFKEYFEPAKEDEGLLDLILRDPTLIGMMQIEQTPSGDTIVLTAKEAADGN